MAIRWTQRLLLILATAATSTMLGVQAQAASFEFPQDPKQWINFPPVTVESLAGKGVILWFYEEGCPRCRAKWPEMLKTAQKYQGQPVVFMAVNSGNSRSAVQGYARSVHVNWPIIVDQNRELEKAAGVPEISLQNIYQLRILKADGQVIPGNPGDLEGAIKTALDGAAWRVDPADMPAELKPSWMAIELGDFAGTGPSIRRALNSSDANVKAAAERLNAAAQEELEKAVAKAKSAHDQGNHWEAYQAYEQVADRFRGFELPAGVEEATKELAANESVINEIKAFKALEAAKKVGQRGSSASIRRAVGMLERLIEESPTTQAATEAQQILQQVNSGG